MYPTRKRYIILDIQGFMVNDGEFVPKELASYDSDDRISHHVFQPSHSFSSLSSKYRNTANWLMLHHHCIEWNDGFVPLSQFDHIIRYLTRNVQKVYVKGSEKIKFLQNIVPIRIIEVDEHVRKFSKGTPMCTFHRGRVSMCALSNVHYLSTIVDSRLTQVDERREGEEVEE